MKIRINEVYKKDFLVSESMVYNFAECTGDENPVHLNEEFAEKTIFGRRIAHGFLVGSLISTVLGNYFPGNGTIYVSQTMRFLKPVYLNDNITVIVEVLEITAKKWLRLRTNCIKSNSEIVIEGEALIIPPKNFEIII